MSKQLALCFTRSASASLRSLWDRLRTEDREQLINLLASPLARAAKAQSRPARKKEVNDAVNS